jgi:hypothetical protein
MYNIGGLRCTVHTSWTVRIFRAPDLHFELLGSSGLFRILRDPVQESLDKWMGDHGHGHGRELQLQGD